MKVATHIGSAFEIVQDIARHLKVQLVAVKTPEQALREKFDALLLLGGNDINPSLYDEQN